MKSFYNISTKTPKCPCPEESPIIPDLCAASDKSAHRHENAMIGNLTSSHPNRSKLMEEITNKFNYSRLIFSKPKYVENIHKKYVFGYKLFNLSDILWKDVLYWQ